MSEHVPPSKSPPNSVSESTNTVLFTTEESLFGYFINQKKQIYLLLKKRLTASGSVQNF
jgi:hypothetical protein